MFKQSCFMVFFLMFITLTGYSQGSNWNSTIDLNVTANSADRIDLYTDADGNHVILHKSNQLVYYLFSATGSQIRSSVIDNFTEDPRLSRIAGWQGNVYISYKKSGAIQTKKSTNGGSSWGDLDNITLPNSTSNGLDLWTDGNGLHIAYSAYDPNDSDYNTYYRRHSHVTAGWQDFKEVTDLEGDAGGFPSVTTSANRVHVAFTAGDNLEPLGRNESKTRDRSSGTWQSSQQLIGGDAAISLVIANSAKLHGFYYGFMPLTYELRYKNRDLGAASWPSNSTLLEQYSSPSEPVDMAVTADDQVHIAFFSLSGDRGKYNVWNNNWPSTPFGFASDNYVFNQQIAPNSNDVYVIWIADKEGGYTLKMRQRDFAPLIPTSVAGSIEDPAGDKHPRLDWNANGEADLSGYEIHKKVGSGSWAWLATTTSTYYVDETVTGASFQQHSNNVVISYKIRAKDLQNHFSDFTSPVDFNTRGSAQDKLIGWKPVDSTVPGEFALLQNYPNPFNPVTTIQFALKEAGPAEVAVYSMDGRKIATLLNEFMEAGFYQVPWDGKDQQGHPASSGMYLYQLKAGNQRLVKKMMLIK